MIQRKQTLFLFLAVIAYALCLFLPVMGIVPQGMGADAMVYNLGTVSGDGGIQMEATCMPLFLLCAVSAVIALVAIFMYKNRKLQINLCSIGMLFSVLWCIDYALLFFGIVGLPEVEGTRQLKFAACLPVISIILVAMAKKGVSDDEKLVRAADRIR